ncbi:GNAT family N-acetyltransferase, partial [Streptomyces violascens]
RWVCGCAARRRAAWAAAAGLGRSSPAAPAAWAVALAEYGLTTLTAVTTLDNIGSRTVLARTGFTPTTPLQLDGRPGLRFVRDLRLGR